MRLLGYASLLVSSGLLLFLGRNIARGWTLERKFTALGTPAGRTKADIIAIAGPPTDTSSLADGKMLFQWLGHGYQLALLFDGERCERVMLETKVSAIRLWTRGRTLERKVAAAGTLVGKSKAEVIAIVGPPNGTSALAEDSSHCYWIGRRYRIGLRFVGETCEGVIAVSKAFAP